MYDIVRHSTAQYGIVAQLGNAFSYKPKNAFNCHLMPAACLPHCYSNYYMTLTGMHYALTYLQHRLSAVIFIIICNCVQKCSIQHIVLLAIDTCIGSFNFTAPFTILHLSVFLFLLYFIFEFLSLWQSIRVNNVWCSLKVLSKKVYIEMKLSWDIYVCARMFILISATSNARHHFILAVISGVYTAIVGNIIENVT